MSFCSTGKAIDAVAFSTNHGEHNTTRIHLATAVPTIRDSYIVLPASPQSLGSNHEFMHAIYMLVGMSLLCGVCSGLRGALFLWAEARLSVRLRRDLFDAIMAREIAFFDATETGDITSRLTSDTTKVTDCITLNLNVFLRSFVQAVGVVIFMGLLNWKLTLVTFVSIPIVTVISRVYGSYYQKLSKKVQDSLAHANEVAEQVSRSEPCGHVRCP